MEVWFILPATSLTAGQRNAFASNGMQCVISPPDVVHESTLCAGSGDKVLDT
ncbi:hypothetical protein KIN20_028137 [Parelaphostrongylus tenuis]|uniref:Uncharacterized protein n=1 Tax=Parelaphostrongylus tenuis TaxID=148309 RepID=A0AAD5R0R5_PARTN|nr:hypothetical protein KIN20_028137 [Parelaphostrongylus tenuis]